MATKKAKYIIAGTYSEKDRPEIITGFLLENVKSGNLVKTTVTEAINMVPEVSRKDLDQYV